MDNTTYEMGRALGRHWAQRDARQEQIERVKSLGSGKEWIVDRDDSARDLSQLIDPEISDFLGIGAMPSDSFVAGIIDGVQTVDETS